MAALKVAFMKRWQYEVELVKGGSIKGGISDKVSEGWGY